MPTKPTTTRRKRSPEALALADAWDALRAAHSTADRFAIEFWPRFEAENWTLNGYYVHSGHHDYKGDTLAEAVAALSSALPQ